MIEENNRGQAITKMGVFGAVGTEADKNVCDTAGRNACATLLLELAGGAGFRAIQSQGALDNFF